MHQPHPSFLNPHRCHCCPAGRGVSRRGFLGAAALGGAALTGLSWPALAAEVPDEGYNLERTPLVVKPVFLHSVYQRRNQTSWRSWGGIQTEEDVNEEMARIKGELAKLEKEADFPLKFLPIVPLRSSGKVKELEDLKSADTILVYAAGGDNLDGFEGLGKDVVIFCRYRSGPVYLWYEIVSPRFLRHHTDDLMTKGIDNRDVVIDSQGDILWRLRALCGLKNTLGTKIVALGGPGGWATPDAPQLAKDRWKLEIVPVTYDELSKIIQAAREDSKAVAKAKAKADAYLTQKDVKLETDRGFVEKAFLLEQIFQGLMARVGARAFTINHCMGTIMGHSETTACLTLSSLNDSGYQAFCESDFVVVPAGMLLTNISARPCFLNDPTYPYDGIITLAHCTAPRRMDGKNFEPVRLLTHFESDYGASPKVEMQNGNKVTSIIPDFKEERWVGLLGEITDHPFFPICRSQIDISFRCPSERVADRMPGFHWMTIYGDYMKEVGYAMGKTQVAWEDLG